MALLKARWLPADDDIQLAFGILASLLAFLTLLAAVNTASKCHKLRSRRARRRHQTSDIPLDPTSTSRDIEMQLPSMKRNDTVPKDHWTPFYPPLGSSSPDHSFTQEYALLWRCQTLNSPDTRQKLASRP